MEIEEIKEKLRAFICKEIMNKANYPLKDQDALITGGLMDSFALAQVGVFIEDAFGIYIPDVDLTVEKMDTLAQMAARVAEKAA